jgi:DNA-binding transcriptional LysR family regulator
MLSRGGGNDDGQFQGLGRFGQRHHVVLQLSRRIVANPRHKADLVVDEDERGVFRCKRLIGAGWVGHDILLQKGKVSCGCGRRCDAKYALMPRLLSDDMIGLKQAAIKGLGVVALPGYVCREEVRSGALRRVLPNWLAGDSTITALIPYRQGLLPSVRVFLDHLAMEFPKAVLM